MLVLAVFQIRQAYISVSSNMNTLPAEKYLTEILLASFNNCYEPADNNGRVRYIGSPDLDFGNRYTGVHPYFFVASLLDPCTRDLLSSDDGYNNSRGFLWSSGCDFCSSGSAPEFEPMSRKLFHQPV